MMKRKTEKKSDEIIPGGIDEYINKMPEGARVRLREIRAAKCRGPICSAPTYTREAWAPLSVAVVLREGSTIAVVLNVVRLLAWRERIG